MRFINFSTVFDVNTVIMFCSQALGFCILCELSYSVMLLQIVFIEGHWGWLNTLKQGLKIGPHYPNPVPSLLYHTGSHSFIRTALDNNAYPLKEYDCRFLLQNSSRERDDIIVLTHKLLTPSVTTSSVLTPNLPLIIILMKSYYYSSYSSNNIITISR